jgi:hypothetical protein
MANQIAPADPTQNQPNQNPAPPPPPTPDQAQKAKDAALENHPAVQHASVLRKVAETIAGGPRTITSFDPETGERIEKKQPLTSKQILAGALANILGGISQAAGGFAAGMQHRPAPPPQPLPTVAADQQRAQQSQEDFERQQNMRVRKAKVMQANLETMRLSYALRHEEDEALDQVITTHKDAVEASNIPSSELLAKGYDRSRYLAVADGRVPVYDKNTGQRVTNKDGVPVSELSYSVVDGTTQAPLTQEKYDQLARYGLMQTKEGFKLPEGATISSAQLALLNNKLGLIFQTQRELDEVHDAVGGEKVDLAAKIKQNPKILSAIEAFHNDGTSDDPAKQLVNLRASKNPKAQAAVGTMISLFGQDNLDKWIQKQAGTDFKNVEDARKKLADDASNVKVNPDGTVTYSGKDSGAQDAANFLNLSVKQENAQKAGQKNAEANAGGKDADIEFAAKSLANGDFTSLKDIASMRGDERLKIYARAKQINPNFNTKDIDVKLKTANEFANGKQADQIQSFNTFLGHAGEAATASGNYRRSGSPLINRPLNWIEKNAANDADYQTFVTALQPVRDEYMTFLQNNHALTESDKKAGEVIMSNDSTPAQVEAALKGMSKTAFVRLGALNDRYKRVMGSDFPDLLDQNATDAANLLGLGGEAAKYKIGGRVTGSATGAGTGGKNAAPTSTQNQSRVVPAGATPGRDAQGNIVGYRAADGRVVTF